VTFAPSDFLILADSLSQHATGESEHRTAVDRAYYGLFLMTREGIGVTSTGANVHVVLEREASETAQSKQLRPAGACLGSGCKRCSAVGATTGR
jgi:hypothetical protein